MPSAEPRYHRIMVKLSGEALMGAQRFGIEPEITAKIAKGRWRVFEVPIGYQARTWAGGKKIGWKDGVSAIFAILKYNLRRRRP